MTIHEEDIHKNKRIIIRRLAHHSPNREDFEDHVFYLFNYALCIGCFAFLFGTTIALIIGNLFYIYIVNYISLLAIFIFASFCWIASILQYSLQIFTKKPLKNRTVKFLIRMLYPLGSIILIFKNPILGLSIAIPAGYLIVYIRKIKERTFKIPIKED